MSGGRKPVGVVTRRAVSRIFGAADSLPERSKASKVLTAVACRLQLFVYELERARFEDFGLSIEQLLDRLHEHCQLLSVASVQGGSVQSGYALLSELLELLQELESSVLLLPGQLGGDARYKPALDELQALLASVSYYRLECEETKQRMEAALSELVRNCPTAVGRQSAATKSPPVSRSTSKAGSPGKTSIRAGVAAGGSSAGGGGGDCSSSNNGSNSPLKGAVRTPGAVVDTVTQEQCGGIAADVALLQRVRQVICELDLDVEMAEGAQDLDAELLLLRDQMQQELQQQLQHGRQQQQQQQAQQLPPQHQQILELDDPDPQPHVTAQSVIALPRSGARKRREGPSGTTTPSSSECASPAFPLSPTGALPPAVTPQGAARLHAARHVSRRLAAQHLARLKEQQRQLCVQNAVAAAATAAGAGTASAAVGSTANVTDIAAIAATDDGGVALAKATAADSSDDIAVQPAARRRKVTLPETVEESVGADVAAAAVVTNKATWGDVVLTVDANLLQLPKGKVASAAVSAACGTSEAAEVKLSLDECVGVADMTAGVAGVEQDGQADLSGVCREGSNAASPARRVGGYARGKNTDGSSDPRVSGVDGSSASALGSDDRNVSTVTGTVGTSGEESDGSYGSRRRSGSYVASDSEVSSDGSLGALRPKPCEASVAALRKLNRVTTLTGMWEAGRPVAQQSTAEFVAAADAPGAASGGVSDCEDRSDGCSSDTSSGGCCEQPARPAARRRAAPMATVTARLPGRDNRAAVNNSPFVMLAMQRRPTIKGPDLARVVTVPPENEPALDEVPASPAASAHGGDGGGGGGEVNTLPHSPAGGGPPGCLRIRGTGAVVAAAAAAVPAPLPLPDASVHLRAVGLPGCFAPHWGPPGPNNLLAALHPAAAAGGGGSGGGGPWGLAGPSGAADSGEGGGGGNGGGSSSNTELLDFGPDVPTLDLHRDITGWGPCLGRGAFGAVYKALFRNKPAAIKVLHGGALDVRDMRALRTEISLLCRLRHHPNIITVYGAAAAPPDRVALVTELMDCDLYDYIHRRRQNCVPTDEVLSIARAIASGLSELHPAIVHRDLKPANVLLRHSAPANLPPCQSATGPQGGGPGGVAGAPSQQQLDNSTTRRLTVKIADFGLARHKRSQYLSTRDRDAGTLKYMAPECIASGIGGGGGGGGGGEAEDGGGDGSCFTKGGGITEKCDIYSFGVLLYELITGREPWEGCHPLYAMCQVQSGVTLQLPDDPVRCPPALGALIQRCWSYQHHKRPSSRELLRELDGIIAAQQQQQQQLMEGLRRGGGGGGVNVSSPPAATATATAVAEM